jgi:predicted ATP-grasp superfamily ATP-dependent carboligase
MIWKDRFVMALDDALVVLVHEWVTGGGLAGEVLPNSWQREGSAMRLALARDFAAISCSNMKVIMTLDARLSAEPGRWRVESIGPGEHRRKLRELCRTADFTVLVAPETRGILAKLTRELLATGARVLGSSATAIELTGDKARLAVQLERLGIDTPSSQTIVPSEGLPGLTRYPAVLKPVDGAGSIDTFYLDSPGGLSEEARRMPRALLQPFVSGDPMSASFVVSPEGESWLVAIGRQRVERYNGRFEYHGGVIPAFCPGATDQVRRALTVVQGLAGFVGVDFIWDGESHRATILEINPRPTTSVVGLCRLLPEGLLARALLEACGQPPRDEELLASLAACVQGQTAVAFDAAGNIAGRFE